MCDSKLPVTCYARCSAADIALKRHLRQQERERQFAGARRRELRLVFGSSGVAVGQLIGRVISATEHV